MIEFMERDIIQRYKGKVKMNGISCTIVFSVPGESSGVMQPVTTGRYVSTGWSLTKTEASGRSSPLHERYQFFITGKDQVSHSGNDQE